MREREGYAIEAIWNDGRKWFDIGRHKMYKSEEEAMEVREKLLEYYKPPNTQTRVLKATRIVHRKITDRVARIDDWQAVDE